MRLPPGFAKAEALELGGLIESAYRQFDRSEDGGAWELPSGFSLLAELRYDGDPVLPGKLGAVDGYIRDVVKRFREPSDVPVGFLAVREDVLCAVFRGTRTVKEWAGNLNARLKDFPGSPGRAHEGFLHSYGKIRPALADAVGRTGRRTRILLAGHSLGGAMATLAAVDIESSMGRKAAALYTFGSPRVGDRAFAEDFRKRLGGRAFRVANSCDLVPSLPPPAPLAHIVGGYYVHVGEPACFTRQTEDVEDNHSMAVYLEAVSKGKDARPSRGIGRRILSSLLPRIPSG